MTEEEGGGKGGRGRLFQGRKERGSLLGSRNRDAKVKVWI